MSDSEGIAGSSGGEGEAQVMRMFEPMRPQTTDVAQLLSGMRNEMFITASRDIKRASDAFARASQGFASGDTSANDLYRSMGGLFPELFYGEQMLRGAASFQVEDLLRTERQSLVRTAKAATKATVDSLNQVEGNVSGPKMLEILRQAKDKASNLAEYYTDKQREIQEQMRLTGQVRAENQAPKPSM